jgi:hypothetical protein
MINHYNFKKGFGGGRMSFLSSIVTGDSSFLPVLPVSHQIAGRLF